MTAPLHIVFTAFPGPGNECVFVEVETPEGKSVNAGEWRSRPDGLVELVMTPTTEVSEAMVERAVSAALGADIIPIEGGGEGVRIADYLELPSPGGVVELGVSLGIGDDGKPRFHWLSDVRSDELDDFRRAVLRPIIRAALIAALSLPASPTQGELKVKALREIAALRYVEDEDVFDTLEQALDTADAALAALDRTTLPPTEGGAVTKAEIAAFRAKYREFFPGSVPDLVTCRELLEASREAVKAGNDAFREELAGRLALTSGREE